MIRLIKTCLMLVLVSGLAVAALVSELLVFFPDRPGPGEGRRHEVHIAAGSGPRAIAARLNEVGVINGPLRFAWWLRLTGRLPLIQAGQFEVSDNLTPHQLVDQLCGPGLAKGVKVTIPEGFTLRQIGQNLEQAGLFSAQQFLAAATDRDGVTELGLPGPTAEGYLFPNTYYFDPSATPSAVITAMHVTLRDRLSELGKVEEAELKRLVTLASIVQSESRHADEMPIVAGVYTNRLTSPEFPSRLLQADPTVAYGCEPFVRPRAPSCLKYRGVLVRSQLNDGQNPYNTYRHPGLPPGPICAVGLDALKAAHRPADVPYLFFVVGQQGRHVFSRTLAEHQKAVAEYRKRR